MTSLRQSMPQVTAFIDELRHVFGREHIDAQILAGINGKPVFHAVENGHEVGTPLEPRERVSGKDLVLESIRRNK
ncbi:MAG: hypothetical protein E2576_11075 [Alcaligenaceae bacterium]|nr:hypothetical protein [Alcaligenaceae bacterium SAGV5]MPS51250.1 hypothetical protein [Alcaligenaceae bacterium SAGV3]MPT57253.1 hypothetical protein [Alcaligenaceae bacterium]